MVWAIAPCSLLILMVQDATTWQIFTSREAGLPLADIASHGAHSERGG